MRRVLFAVAGALVAASAAYWLYWQSATGRLAEGLAGWTAEWRAEGYRVAGVEPEWGGFPWALTARLASPELAAPDGAWTWRGPDIEARARPWRPYTIRLTFPGRHELSLPGRVVAIEAGAAEGTLELGEGRLALVFSEVVAMEGSATAAAESAAVEVALPPAPPADYRMSGLDFALRLAGVELPAGVPAALRQPIALAELSGAIMGRPPTISRENLAAWRDAGGTLEIRRLALDWGPLDLAAEGTVALDRDLQPEAALSAAFSGHNEAIDRLVEAGIVTPRRALVAKLALSALARPAPEGGPRVTVPVTLQDGFLYLGPAKLIPVPPIDWR